MDQRGLDWVATSAKEVKWRLGGADWAPRGGHIGENQWCSLGTERRQRMAGFWWSARAPRGRGAHDDPGTRGLNDDVQDGGQR